MRRALRRSATSILLASLYLACWSQEEPAQRWIRPMGETRWVLETVLRPEVGQSREMIMNEVTEFPDREATPEERARADKLIQDSFRAAHRHGWFDFENAQSQGFEPMFHDPTHFMNRAFIRDDRVADPDRPEFLMYYPNPENEDEMLLVGFMFRTRMPLDRGPQIAGPLTLWHYHVWNRDVSYCVDEFHLPLGMNDEQDGCSEGEPTRWSPEMLHVWFTDHPRGAFSSVMNLPPRRLAEIDYEEMAQRILGEDGSAAE
jgi:hypothetical protein